MYSTSALKNGGSLVWLFSFWAFFSRETASFLALDFETAGIPFFNSGCFSLCISQTTKSLTWLNYAKNLIRCNKKLATDQKGLIMHITRIIIRITNREGCAEVKKRITCSVVGARGYTGIETARLLLQHPNAQLVSCFATSEFKLSKYLSSPAAAQVKSLLDSELMQNLTDVVFLATPAEVSLKLAPQILAAGKKVIDLSGAFRLKQNEYPTWYGFEHTEKALLQSAQYGLAPFVGPASGSGKLIANPGCYVPLANRQFIFSTPFELMYTARFCRVPACARTKCRQGGG